MNQDTFDHAVKELHILKAFMDIKFVNYASLLFRPLKMTTIVKHSFVVYGCCSLLV